MRRRAPLRLCWGALVLVGALVPSAQAVAGPPPRSRVPASVIALTEIDGVNVLHQDFRTRDGKNAVLPPSARGARVVHLPRSGTFEERIAAARKGPLGDLKEETLYYIAGTRLLLYVPRDVDDFSLFRGTEHPTGTASAAVGLEFGTNPDALLVYVPASTGGWDWLRRTSWIDVVSASYYTVVSPQGRCGPNDHIRAIARGGRAVFAAAGNVEQTGIASSPSGAVGAYQVGGVDSEGRPYSPASNPLAPRFGTTSTRPYETGDRMEFPAATYDAVKGSQPFGGTSGATPSTAGRATLLIEHARRLLGSTQVGVVRGALARASRSVAPPPRGPLSDGDFTGGELTDLLHGVATPYTPPNPVRYYTEGYGALNADAVDRAKRVLEGRETLGPRPDDDAQHEQWEAWRESFFQAACA